MLKTLCIRCSLPFQHRSCNCGWAVASYVDVRSWHTITLWTSSPSDLLDISITCKMPRRDLTKSLEAVQRLFNVEPEPEPEPSQLEPRESLRVRAEPRHPVRLFAGRTTAHSHQVWRELSDESLVLRRDLRRKDELITEHRAYIDLLERTIGDKDLLPGTTWYLGTESTNEVW